MEAILDFIREAKEYNITLLEPDFNEDSKVSIVDLVRFIDELMNR